MLRFIMIKSFFQLRVEEFECNHRHDVDFITRAERSASGLDLLRNPPQGAVRSAALLISSLSALFVFPPFCDAKKETTTFTEIIEINADDLPFVVSELIQVCFQALSAYARGKVQPIQHHGNRQSCIPIWS